MRKYIPQIRGEVYYLADEFVKFLRTLVANRKYIDLILILKFFISNIMDSEFKVTHLQLIRTYQFSIFLDKEGTFYFYI